MIKHLFSPGLDLATRPGSTGVLNIIKGGRGFSSPKPLAGGGGGAVTPPTAKTSGTAMSSVFSGNAGMDWGGAGAAVGASALTGGVSALTMSRDGGFGTFVGGAMAGATVGGIGRGLANANRGLIRNTGAAIGRAGRDPSSWAAALGGRNIGAGIQSMSRPGSSAGRAATFAGGGMLGGAAFGMMFGGSGRSHKRGFNQHRGNNIRR